MKNLLILVIILTSSLTFSQNNADNLNDKKFSGTAAEILPPDVDRLPMVFDETINFQNGKFYSSIFRLYGIEEADYTSFVDDRRMVALEVIKIYAEGEGSADGKKVKVVFDGEILGDTRMSGTIKAIYQDNSEANFLVSLTAK